MSWDGLVQQLAERHYVKVDVEKFRKKFAANTEPSSISVADAFQRVLHDNLNELVASGLLPRNVGSLQTATIEAPVMVQIQTSRDATQPLRPCADMDDADALLNAANQKATNHRLLKLTVSDGAVEFPAVELQTLRLFRGVPIPGEKLLIKVGAEVRNGMLILTDKDIVSLGGSEQHLKDEFLLRKQRLLHTGTGHGGLEGAPKFAPLSSVTNVSHSAAAASSRTKGNHGGHSQPHRQEVQPQAQAQRDPAQGHHGPSQRDQGNRHEHSKGGSGRGRGASDNHRERGGGRGRGGHQDRGGRGGHDRGGRGGRDNEFQRQPRSYQDPYTTTSSRPAPAAPPKFSDADFPSLGGDW